MKRVIVTGAAGFIGRYVVPILLERGFEVHAPLRGRGPRPWPGGRVYEHDCDLLDRDSVARLCDEVKASHLLHLAWITAPGRYWTSWENVAWEECGLELFRSFAENGGARIVAAGSCAEYDWDYGYCSEGLTPLNPASIYGRCKAHLHGLLQQLALDMGFSYAWPRIFLLYGPHEKPERIVPSMIDSLLAGRSTVCNHPRLVRDYLFVEDVASALAALLDSGLSGPINVGSGRALPLGELAGILGGLVGRPELITLAESTGAAKHEFLVANPARLRQELNWTPAFGLEAGLRRCIAWRRGHPEGRAGAGQGTGG